MIEKPHPLIDKERQKLAKSYHSDTLKISISSYIIYIGFLIILLYFNISRDFVNYINSITNSRFLMIFLYFLPLFIIYTIITFPFSYIGGYRIEHKYKFSTQNFREWFFDEIKSFLLSFILGVLIFEFIYLITKRAPGFWWLWLSVIMIAFSVILSNLFPVLILPLFYKTSPIEDGNLKKRIIELCNQVNLNIQGIFRINLSSKTTKANAAVTGLGNTKRILVGDTLLSEYSEDEIVSAIAHEITHYKEHHIWWSVLWQSIITVVVFYIFFRSYPFLYNLVGFERASEIAAFPMFAIILGVISFLFKPLGASISRYYERRADKGALDLTKDPEAFVKLIAGLCNRQLTLAYPNPIIEWYKYSHPSPGKRIKFAESWKIG